MEIRAEIVREYISFFFSKIVGFERQEVKFLPINHSHKEFLSIAMDKVERLNRKGGKLRIRVWSNCYFIFHGSGTDPSSAYKAKVAEVKKQYPYLFVRSFVYFIFIDISKTNELLNGPPSNISTNQFKIWVFNSKYELHEETKRSNLFGIRLDQNESIDDYVYLANPASELERIEAANSDAIDCVRAFTGDLELLGQTAEILDVVRSEFKKNPNARIILEGPARSGKTIIAAILLGEYEDSKLLLMNYFFYQAIVDGFHALSGLSEQEIGALVKNPDLDLLLSLKDKVPYQLKRISENLSYAVEECGKARINSKTAKWLIENISQLNESIDKLGLGSDDLFVLTSLRNLKSKLSQKTSDEPFKDINKSNLVKLKEQIDGLLSGQYEALKNLQDKIINMIKELVANSKQKFFHHNINTKISSKLKEGCWIKRGEKTMSRMWFEDVHPALIICDEVQRLGRIPAYHSFDEFDEVKEILKHSRQSFFTGDNFQMLNHKYDEGINRISEEITKRGESLSRFTLPETVGVPAEIGVLNKYLTNPGTISCEEVAKCWRRERDFEMVFIDSDSDQLVLLFDEDKSGKKHLASPMDLYWMDYGEDIQISTNRRRNPIIPLKNHHKENFAYKFPYFCNEEIMPNYLLSAYELISREVESLYVHIPIFRKLHNDNIEWYRKHLYVLFTRPTGRLVVNFESKEEFNRIKSLVGVLQKSGAQVPASFY